MAVLPLFGRDRELGVLNDLVDRAHGGGGALVLRGEAGIGKSSLLAAISDRARDGRMAVLTSVGVQSETHLPFAGLHQLLRPILDRAEDLPDRQRAALLAAFGMTEATAPEFFLIALAALDLLADAAADSPLLLVAEDAHWLDRATCDVLAFVARRLESEPIALLIAIREGYDNPLGEEASLPELRLEGLDADAAGALLDAHAPGLAPAVRERLLEEAAGNPLALVELPDALGSDQLGGATGLPDLLPLTQRLERAFAARMSELPEATRSLLLVAAVDDGGVLSEVLEAATILQGTAPAVEAVHALAPAVAARLVEVDETQLRFRHPLVRSATHQAASVPERHAAHAALAQVLAGQPDRRVWHRAASAAGPDEEVAAELESAAAGARQRGGIVVAVVALERAAKLTEDPARRAGRLLRAAELAHELGRRDLVLRLLHEAEPLELGSLERARMLWIREMVNPRIPGQPQRASLVEAAERVRADGDTDLALNLLWLVASRDWWADPGREARETVIAAAERMSAVAGDLRLLSIIAYAAPIERGRFVIDRLSRSASDGGSDAGATRLLGSAALVVGAFDLAAGFLATSGAALRTQGRLGHLARVLVLQAWAAFYLADWHVAMPSAEEAGRLAAETREPIWAAGAQVVKAMLAAARGQRDLAEALAVQAEQAVLPLGAHFILAAVQLARGLSALGSGHHADAHQHLRRVFDPTDPAYHPFMRCWAIGDLAEAAVHSGRRDAARAVLEELEPAADQTPSPWFQAGMRYARSLLADDEDAEALFQEALSADLTRLPFARARLLLAYGAWLRRQRRVAESRAPLRAARETFDALGILPWGERARQELRAAGETSGRRRTAEAWDQLTPQELQIAQMAADGLSNREIGQQLYLSHRTVGSYLYRVFPKLGITSRSQLRAVLDGGIASLA